MNPKSQYIAYKSSSVGDSSDVEFKHNPISDKDVISNVGGNIQKNSVNVSKKKNKERGLSEILGK